MKGYWLSVYEKVADPEIQKKYAEKATVAIKKFGGVFLCRGGKNLCFEGSKSSRTVIVEFSSYESAEKCSEPAHRLFLRGFLDAYCFIF